MSEPSHAVFLSYASQDAEAARRIAEALRAAGVEVWFDQTELRGGDAWDRQIRKQIHDCALFMPIISAHSQERLEGYFRREWKLAVDRTHDMAEEKAFLVPVVIDGTSERDASVPDRFRDVQWSRLPAGETASAFVQRVQGLISPAPPLTDRGPVSTQASVLEITAPRRAVLSRTSVLLLAIALLVLATTVYVTVNRPRTTRSAAAPPTATATAPSNSNSIAVLPFADLSEKKDQQYFADGMADEVLDLLAKIPGLSVIGRTSSFQFRDKAMDVRSIGAALGAAYILEGSVRKSTDHIRVTAQLLETRNGTHRWSDTFDAELVDVLKVQDGIARGIARALELAVENSADTRGINSAAYDLNLKGLRLTDSATQESCEEAAADFQRALDLDSTFVAAASNLTLADDCLAEQQFVPPKIGFERVRADANRVLVLDPKNAKAHTFLAIVHDRYDWDWGAASREVDTAMKLGSHDAFTLLTASAMAEKKGDWSRALTLDREAVAQDPLDGNSNLQLGWLYARLGRYAEAEKLTRRALELSPNYPSAHSQLAMLLLLQNRANDALVEANKETAAGGQLESLAIIYYALRQPTQSDNFLSRAIEKDAHVWTSGIAAIYAFRDDHAKAIEWLNRAYDERDGALLYIQGDPFFRSLHNDAGYQLFLRKMKLPAE